MKTVLVTGAAGNVGSQLRSEFAGRYKLRLSDKRLLRPSAGETFVQADIVELADVLTISEGTDTIVHLGGTPVKDLGKRSCRLTSSDVTTCLRQRGAMARNESFSRVAIML